MRKIEDDRKRLANIDFKDIVRNRDKRLAETIRRANFRLYANTFRGPFNKMRKQSRETRIRKRNYGASLPLSHQYPTISHYTFLLDNLNSLLNN